MVKDFNVLSFRLKATLTSSDTCGNVPFPNSTVARKSNNLTTSSPFIATISSSLPKGRIERISPLVILPSDNSSRIPPALVRAKSTFKRNCPAFHFKASATKFPNATSPYRPRFSSSWNRTNVSVASPITVCKSLLAASSYGCRIACKSSWGRTFFTGRGFHSNDTISPLHIFTFPSPINRPLWLAVTIHVSLIRKGFSMYEWEWPSTIISIPSTAAANFWEVT